MPLGVAGALVGPVVRYLPGHGGESPANGFRAGGGFPAPAGLGGIGLRGGDRDWGDDRGMLRLPMTSVLLATLFLGSTGLTVIPLVIVGVVVSYVITLRLPDPGPHVSASAPEPAPVPAPAPAPAPAPEPSPTTMGLTS